MLINGKYRCAGCMAELPEENSICKCGFGSTDKNPEHCLPIGTVLNSSYVVGKVIGEGGFGITYVGWEQDLDFKIAIKEFYLSGHSSRNTTIANEISANIGEGTELFELYKEKFISEARILASFIKENGIVTVFKYFKENNTAYIVMEFLEGETLKQYLERKGKISIQETFSIIKPVMDSLEKVHGKNLIHRDISPDNIIITEDGHGKLLDFGAAREVTDGKKSLSVVLKHGYAPIEQYQTHGNQGPWTDVYALCATMYKCITGDTPTEVTERAVGGEIVAPDHVGACGKEVSKALLKGMEIQVKNRYKSMKELSDALEKAIEIDSKESKAEESVSEPVHFSKDVEEITRPAMYQRTVVEIKEPADVAEGETENDKPASDALEIAEEQVVEKLEEQVEEVVDNLEESELFDDNDIEEVDSANSDDIQEINKGVETVLLFDAPLNKKEKKVVDDYKDLEPEFEPVDFEDKFEKPLGYSKGTKIFLIIFFVLGMLLGIVINSTFIYFILIYIILLIVLSPKNKINKSISKRRKNRGDK